MTLLKMKDFAKKMINIDIKNRNIKFSDKEYRALSVLNEKDLKDIMSQNNFLSYNLLYMIIENIREVKIKTIEYFLNNLDCTSFDNEMSEKFKDKLVLLKVKLSNNKEYFKDEESFKIVYDETDKKINKIESLKVKKNEVSIGEFSKIQNEEDAFNYIKNKMGFSEHNIKAILSVVFNENKIDKNILIQNLRAFYNDEYYKIIEKRPSELNIYVVDQNNSRIEAYSDFIKYILNKDHILENIFFEALRTFLSFLYSVKNKDNNSSENNENLIVNILAEFIKNNETEYLLNNVGKDNVKDYLELLFIKNAYKKTDEECSTGTIEYLYCYELLLDFIKGYYNPIPFSLFNNGKVKNKNELKLISNYLFKKDKMDLIKFLVVEPNGFEIFLADSLDQHLFFNKLDYKRVEEKGYLSINDLFGSYLNSSVFALNDFYLTMKAFEETEKSVYELKNVFKNIKNTTADIFADVMPDFIMEAFERFNKEKSPEKSNSDLLMKIFIEVSENPKYRIYKENIKDILIDQLKIDIKKLTTETYNAPYYFSIINKLEYLNMSVEMFLSLPDVTISEEELEFFRKSFILKTIIFDKYLNIGKIKDEYLHSFVFTENDEELFKMADYNIKALREYSNYDNDVKTKLNFKQSISEHLEFISQVYFYSKLPIKLYQFLIEHLRKSVDIKEDATLESILMDIGEDYNSPFFIDEINKLI